MFRYDPLNCEVCTMIKAAAISYKYSHDTSSRKHIKVEFSGNMQSVLATIIHGSPHLDNLPRHMLSSLINMFLAGYLERQIEEYANKRADIMN